MLRQSWTFFFAKEDRFLILFQGCTKLKFRYQRTTNRHYLLSSVRWLQSRVYCKDQTSVWYTFKAHQKAVGGIILKFSPMIDVTTSAFFFGSLAYPLHPRSFKSWWWRPTTWPLFTPRQNKGHHKGQLIIEHINDLLLQRLDHPYLHLVRTKGITKGKSWWWRPTTWPLFTPRQNKGHHKGQLIIEHINDLLLQRLDHPCEGARQKCRNVGSMNCNFSVTFIKSLNQSSIKPCQTRVISDISFPSK